MGAEGPPAREASVPAPQGPRRRAAKRLELLVFYIWIYISVCTGISSAESWMMEVPVFAFRPVDETIHVDETKLKKEASLVCDSCGKISQSKSLLYKHRLTHQKLDLPCKLCSKICTTKKNLREHIINVHGERMQCTKCKKSFSSKQERAL